MPRSVIKLYGAKYIPVKGAALPDQILDAHPGLRVLEEKLCIPALANFLAETPAGYPGALAALDVGARRAYARLEMDL